MASSGPNSPSTVVNDSSVGTYAWSSPSSATVSDGVAAEVNLYASAGLTQYLKSTGYGFSIPSGATIDGIVVEYQLKSNIIHALYWVEDSSVRLLKAGTASGSDKTRGAGVKWPTSYTYITYGSSSDLWGTTWTDSDINNANFGTSIIANIVDLAKSGVIADIDHVRITVYYTAAGGGSSQSALLSVSD